MNLLAWRRVRPAALAARVQQRRFLSSSTAQTLAADAADSAEHKKRVVVGMSGGVDSSVTALLLQRQGYDVTGVYMKNWDADDEIGETACPVDSDFMDVQDVCKKLGIPVHMVNLVQSYWNDVFSPCLEEFEEGLTPNPDILCNREIKFKAFLEHAEKLGADYVATGHYARLERHKDGTTTLHAAVDESKDQSYFLSQVSKEALSKVMFPLGDLPKSKVRQLAAEAELSTATKKDSVGICFIGKRDFGDFIHEYIPRQQGYFVSVEDGKRLKEHKGFTSYTIGQNARLAGMQEKWFVVGKRKSDHAVLVAPGTRHPALFTDSLFASVSAFSWVSGHPPIELEQEGTMRCQYRVRYRQPLDWCTVSIATPSTVQQASTSLYEWSEADETTYLRIDFDRPQRGVTPHQALVLYSPDGMCYGGGPISVSGSTYQELGRQVDTESFDWST